MSTQGKLRIDSAVQSAADASQHLKFGAILAGDTVDSDLNKFLTQTCRAGTDDKNIDIAVKCRSTLLRRGSSCG